MAKKVDVKGPRMKGLTLIILLMVAVVAAGGLTVASIYLNGSSTKTASFVGVLTVYASGSPSGANSASYNVTLSATNGNGTMTLTHIRGSSDPVADHSYSLTGVLVSPFNVTMVIAGSNVSLAVISSTTTWTALNDSYGTASGISNSTFWNDLNSSYAAASGPEAPANETIGAFSPSVFQLPTSYYMLIALTIPQPPYTIPFAIVPVMAVRTAAER